MSENPAVDRLSKDTRVLRNELRKAIRADEKLPRRRLMTTENVVSLAWKIVHENELFANLTDHGANWSEREAVRIAEVYL